MRVAYFSGAPGVFASAAVWLVAGAVALQATAAHGMWTLFAGGMLIHPLGLLLSKALGCRGKHDPANPLGALALENTFWMLLCLPLAYGVALYQPQWFFPAMLCVIGGRYLTFRTLYGLRTYWMLGAALGLASWALVALRAPAHVGALAGGALEAVFAVALVLQARRAAAA